MSEHVPNAFDGVRFTCKANVYFEGNVVSHSFEMPDGTKKSAGLIYPGTYTFKTDVAERMEVIAGMCLVIQAGETDSTPYGAGSFFEVPANSSFDITVASGIAEYVCTYQ